MSLKIKSLEDQRFLHKVTHRALPARSYILPLVTIQSVLYKLQSRWNQMILTRQLLNSQKIVKFIFLYIAENNILIKCQYNVISFKRKTYSNRSH